MKIDKLFHDSACFTRETFQKRMSEFGFKNMGRMELFLWDLELCLQIQKRLGERIVLKGGAATQFYLPVEAQRTSVDIDMLFYGKHEEIDAVLDDIRKDLSDGDGLFEFKEYFPENPKTGLPLYTYFAAVPSVLTAAERRTENNIPARQEIKVEFILQPRKREYVSMLGEGLFTVKSHFKYRILPLDSLFADKLSTLGCETIGVQNDRMDEQIKHFYDIIMLAKHCLPRMNGREIGKKYMERAKEEWEDRRGNEPFSIKPIMNDVYLQLRRYEQADTGNDKELIKSINDFHSLYINSNVDFSPSFVACGASFLRLLYRAVTGNVEWKVLARVLEIEKKLEFSQFKGREKGVRVRRLRDRLVEKFAIDSALPVKILKGKNHKRVFWAVADPKNLGGIERLISEIAALENNSE
ncbi:MAG: nucleotidyl transferase AbiEii/AbiGii toxin family protein [Thermoguttaceae bacterium]|nr:nucleotidyl transferase AbiEii/AbiGii toxin family protein [Thermoguttaceae bacterium]